MSTITDEMVERAAQRLWEQEVSSCTWKEAVSEEHPFQNVRDWAEEYRQRVRTVLEAVQPECCLHGYGYEDPASCPACNAEPEDVLLSPAVWHVCVEGDEFSHIYSAHTNAAEAEMVRRRLSHQFSYAYVESSGRRTLDIPEPVENESFWYVYEAHDGWGAMPLSEWREDDSFESDVDYGLTLKRNIEDGLVVSAHTIDEAVHKAVAAAKEGEVMGTTTNRNDPGLRKIDDKGMQERYLVLSDEEIAQGFIRPVRRTYVHVGTPDGSRKGCGAATTMAIAIAQTYARDPHFYGRTYCVGCKQHVPVGQDGECIWHGTDERVGT